MGKKEVPQLPEISPILSSMIIPTYLSIILGGMHTY
jgi:hypothetical protein